jgi:hypothetical protein
VEGTSRSVCVWNRLDHQLDVKRPESYWSRLGPGPVTSLKYFRRLAYESSSLQPPHGQQYATQSDNFALCQPESRNNNHAPTSSPGDIRHYRGGVLFVTLIFLLFSKCLRRLYCLSSESGLRSNKMRSLHWLPGGVNPGVADRLCHSGSNSLPFDFDDITNVCTTLGEHVVRLGLEQTKHKIS